MENKPLRAMEDLLNNQELRVKVCARLGELKLPLVPFNKDDHYSVKLYSFLCHGKTLRSIDTEKGIMISII